MALTERLVRVGRERRPEPGEPRHQLAEDLVAFGPGVERVELEAGADHGARDRLGLVIQRLDVDAARRRLDPDLPPADDAMDAALVPEVRDIRAEGSEPFSRELEVVRIRQRKKSQARERATSCRSPNGS